MSVDIYLEHGDHVVAQMNWIRNPFGIESWLLNNTGLVLRGPFAQRRNGRLATALGVQAPADRRGCLKLAREALKRVDALDEGYWRIRLDWSLMAGAPGAETPADVIARGAKVIRLESELGGPTHVWVEMEDYLAHLCPQERAVFAERPGEALASYRARVLELFEFAEQLQDRTLAYTVSS